VTRGNENARRLFGKVVRQSALFTRAVEGMDVELLELIVGSTATYYPRYRKLKHGLVLGQLSQDLPPGYEGPALQFLYKVLADKVYFIHLKVGGFDEKKLADFEAAYDL
jgi:hypothetical protein